MPNVLHKHKTLEVYRPRIGRFRPNSIKRCTSNKSRRRKLNDCIIISKIMYVDVQAISIKTCI